jgi:hypothetical protein
MAEIVDQLNNKIPNLALEINAETGELNNQIGVVYSAINAYKQLLLVKAGDRKASAAAESLLGLEDQSKQLGNQLSELEKKRAELQAKGNNGIQEGPALRYGLNANAGLMKVDQEITKIKDSITQTNSAIDGANKVIEDSFNLSTKYAQIYGKSPTEPEPKPYVPKPVAPDKNQKSAIEVQQEAAQKALSDLKFALDMGYITEADYYKKLEALRDEYFSKGSSDWQQYTLDLEQYSEKQVDDRRANSDRWIAEQKKYGELTSAEEIAAYERIRTYMTEYYNQGTINYSEYQEQLRDIDEKVFDTRKEMLEKGQDEDEKARKKAIDSINNMQSGIVEALQASYEDQRDIEKQALEDEMDDLEDWKKANIESLNDVYNAKIKAINDEIKALD